MNISAASEHSWRGRALQLVPPLVLVVGTRLLFAYLLQRFPYDGFYGVDSYTYYYQARALWREFTGTAPRGFELFTTDGLQHWPVGYHLQIIAGFLLSGVSPTGGWLLTILFSALCPAVLYLIVQKLFRELRSSGFTLFVVVTGLVAGALLPLNATFTRMGLSLMSDTPACFWTLLSIYFFILAAPLPQKHSDVLPMPSGRRNVLFAFAGFALGVAVLIRYGSILLVMPIAVYLLLSAWPAERNGKLFSGLWERLTPVLWSIPPFL